jgi:hypothetical protein
MMMMTPRTQHQQQQQHRSQYQRNTPIVIDSDSDGDDEPDYATQVRNFQDFRRDIADIRSRARNTQIGGMSTRRSRKRRAVEKDSDGGGSGERKEGSRIANESSKSDNTTPATTSLTRANAMARQGGGANTTPGTNALNRFLNNNKSRNPFRAAENSNSNNSNSSNNNNNNTAIPSSTPPTIFLSNPTDRTAIDVDVDVNTTASDPLIEHQHEPTIKLPAIHFLPTTTTRQVFLGQHVSDREAELTRREQALTARQATVARREVAVVERERRLDELVRVVTRQRGQVEGMSRRHGEETDRLFSFCRVRCKDE